MPLVFLDRQHTGQNRRRSATGASRDLDGDGRITAAETEALWTPYYLLAAEKKLRDYGYDVIPLSDGSYIERHSRANGYLKFGELSVYLAGHLNAGAGTRSGYGSMFWDHRSAHGEMLASQICIQLSEQITELRQEVRTFAARPDDWTKNAYYTIKGVRSVAVCSEPAFIDSSQHRPLFTIAGMEKIGYAIADGIHNYFELRRSEP